MFPITYVEVNKQLIIPAESLPNQKIHNVIAVFTFKPECWEDLYIQVINKIF